MRDRVRAHTQKRYAKWRDEAPEAIIDKLEERVGSTSGHL
jgi:adenosyl cobinamide kinase/adenosyl cobinamide phosphate guanylyltransferase